jgi:hypothetical protein
VVSFSTIHSNIDEELKLAIKQGIPGMAVVWRRQLREHRLEGEESCEKYLSREWRTSYNYAN